MALTRVSWYSLGFNLLDKKYYFYYGLEGENKAEQVSVNATQCMALADMFRNEGPITYNSDGHYFLTEKVRVGQVEAQPSKPSATLDLYTDPNSNLLGWATSLPEGTKKTRALWAGGIPQGFWAGIEWDAECLEAKKYIDGAVAAGKVPQVLSYSIPGRDLNGDSQGGARNRAAYEAWIDKLIAAIGSRRVIVAYEPDSLTQADNLPNPASRAGRISAMAWAIQSIKRDCPQVLLYVDIGHPKWKTEDQAAALLQEVNIANADGFALNISNFRSDTECVPYGQHICAKLDLPNLGFVYDTSRNGGSPPDPAQWANPPKRRFGKQPQWGNTGIDRCDGWMWWKRVGESDGSSSGDGAPEAGRFWETYLYNDSVGDNVDSDRVSTSSGMLQRPPTPGVSVT